MYNFEADDLSFSPKTWNFEPTGFQCLCIDISENEEFTVFSNTPGTLSVVRTESGKQKYKITQKYSNNQIVSCRFVPSYQNFLIYCTKDGFIFLNDLSTSETVGMTRHLGTSLLLMAPDSYGETFTIACADGSLRVYDVETMQRTQILMKSTVAPSPITRAPNMQSSIYSLVYHPINSNILAAATGKDGVFFWDLRTGNIEKTINGPHIRGNSLDMHDNTVLTASYRDNKQVEFWDFGTGRKLRDIQVDGCIGNMPTSSLSTSTANLLINSPSSAQLQKPLFLTNAKISENGFDFIVGANELNAGIIYTFDKCDQIGQTESFKEHVSSCALSPFGTTVVTGCDDGSVSCHVIRVSEDKINEE